MTNRASWATPISMIARSDLRQRRGSLAMTALLVALVTCAVLATAAGARRSASSLDRLLASTDAGEIEVAVWGADAAETLLERLRTVTGVHDVAVAHAFILDAPTRRDFSLVASPDGSMLERHDRPLLLHGRLPASDAPDEVALNEVAANDLDLEVGDHLVAALAGPELFPALVAGEAFPGFNGPRLDLEVVGIVRLARDLVSGTEADPVGLTSPAFDRAYSQRAAVSTFASADSNDPGAADRVRAVVEGLGISAMGADVSERDEAYANVQSAIDMLSTGLVVFALVALTAGAVTIGQVVNRQVAAAAIHGTAGRAMGLSPRQDASASAVSSVCAGAIGVALGTGLAIAISPAFPMSIARRAEPAQGLSADWAVLIAGASLAITSIAGWSYLTARRSRRQSASSSATIRTASANLRTGPPVVRVACARALPGGDRQRTVLASLFGIGLAVSGVTGIIVMDATLDDAISSPPRWGWTWSTRPDALDPERAEAAFDQLSRDPDIVAAGHLVRGPVTIGGVSMMGEALDVRSGSLAFALAEGRLPVSNSEVALGEREMDALGVGIGDVVRANGADGGVQVLTVVGTVALPIIDTENPGDGAALTIEGLEALSAGTEGGPVLRYRPGADRTRLNERLRDDYGLDASGIYAQPKPPTRLSNLRDVLSLLPAMGLFFAALGVLGLTHALVMSARASRHDTGVLSALGLRRRQLQQIVLCQSALIVLAGAIVGVTIGVLLGRIVWRMSISDIGMLGGPSTPWSALVVVGVGAIGSAVLVALPIAVRSVAIRPAESLRAE